MTLSRLYCATCACETIHRYSVCIHHGLLASVPAVLLDARVERKRLQRLERARMQARVRKARGKVRKLTAAEERVARIARDSLASVL